MMGYCLACCVLTVVECETFDLDLDRRPGGKGNEFEVQCAESLKKVVVTCNLEGKWEPKEPDCNEHGFSTSINAVTRSTEISSACTTTSESQTTVRTTLDTTEKASSSTTSENPTTVRTTLDTAEKSSSSTTSGNPTTVRTTLNTAEKAFHPAHLEVRQLYDPD